MGRDIGCFRGRLFGGFDRGDVAEYIEKLARERNILAEENERLRDEVETLSGELRLAEERERELSEIETPEPDREALDRAERILGELEREYSMICADIDVNSTHTRCEFESAAKRLESLSKSLKAAGGRIKELRRELCSSMEE